MTALDRGLRRAHSVPCAGASVKAICRRRSLTIRSRSHLRLAQLLWPSTATPDATMMAANSFLEKARRAREWRSLLPRYPGYLTTEYVGSTNANVTFSVWRRILADFSTVMYPRPARRSSTNRPTSAGRANSIDPATRRCARNRSAAAWRSMGFMCR